MNEHNDKHEFAFFYQDLAPSLGGREYVVRDASLRHRILDVLRLDVGESIILFNQNVHACCTMLRANKRELVLLIGSVQPNRRYAPPIIFGLPLLKRADFEQAIYALVETGINEIQLLTTEKSQRVWASKDRDRAERIMIAAAEQSKAFALPLLQDPVTLEAFLARENQAKLYFFAINGMRVTSFIHLLEAHNPQQPIILTVGPEGDFSAREKQLLMQSGALSCALTPTILRAHQSIALGAGIVRSVCF